MSAPDTTTETPETTGILPPSGAPAAPAPRWPLGRHGALIAVIVVLSIIALTLAAVLVSGRFEREAALGEVTAARAAAGTASEGLRAAQHERTESVEQLEQLLATVDALGGIGGVGIDDDAKAALAAMRATLELPQADPASIRPAGALELDTASPRELRDYAIALGDYADRLDAIAADEQQLSDQAADEVAALTTAIDAYTAATVVAGSTLLADRSDAADDAAAALRASVESLPEASATELADAIAAYRAAVDAVIASSDRARAPAHSGPIGTGVDDPSSLTVVVNKSRALPSDYAPGDLRRPAGVGNTLPLRAVAAAAAERMAADMAAVGIQLRMSSGYRSYARQQTVYNGFVAREGVAGADEHSARPGHSEHQTGLAADFDDGTGCNLKVCFRDSAGGRWLAENSWRYGFILRYGDGWQPTVGYRFEPWHYRYVGETAAAEMHEQGILTLEEYAGLPASPDYD